MEPFNQQTQETTQRNTLLIERLEQLGYQCFSECCDSYTTLTIKPLDEKMRTEESLPEIVFSNQIKEQNN